jgi:outer membrane protein TolC
MLESYSKRFDEEEDFVNLRLLGYCTTVVVLSCSSAQAENNPLNLTLKDAVKMAVEKNLDVRAELYNPAQAEADVRKNKGIYDPVISFLTSYQRSATKQSNTFFANVSRTSSTQYNLGISQLLPTGGEIGASFENSRNTTNASNSLKTYYQSDLNLTLSQPLLKNFGRETTDLNINVAAYAKEGSLERFKAKLNDTVLSVVTQYYTLYGLLEDRESKKVALQLNEKILAETKARVKAGVLPAMEILNAEFGLAQRQKDLIDAEKALRDEYDVVRLLLQLQDRRDIVPVDVPTRDEIVAKEDDALQTARSLRPELKEQMATQKSIDLQKRVAKNRTLPDLSLNMNFMPTGLDTDYPAALGNIGAIDYPVWSVGLRFSYPLGNRAAQNDYIKSALKSEQNLVQTRSVEENIANEVRTAIRGLVSGYQQIAVADRGLEFATERVRSFIKKNEVGLATTKDVIDVTNDQVAAKTNQIRALANYAVAIVQYWKATGEILDREGITLKEKDADELYAKSN